MKAKTGLFILLAHCCLSFASHAAAPVVDENDQLASFDEGREETIVSSRHYQDNYHQNAEEPIARRMPRASRASASLEKDLSTLQQELQSLRGELEEQTHALEKLKQQQLTFYKDIDARIHQVATTHPKAPVKAQPITPPPAPAAAIVTKPEAAPTTLSIDSPAPPTQNTITVPAPAPTALKNPADEQIAYLAAYRLIKAKQYPQALQSMTTLVTQYPHGSYTANAEYWIGELYLANKQPTDALKHFEIVCQQFPSSSKVAASALKIGYALSAMGQNNAAKDRFRQVIKNYPDTSAALLAKAKLKAL